MKIKVLKYIIVSIKGDNVIQSWTFTLNVNRPPAENK